MDWKELTADEQQKLSSLLHQTHDPRQYRRVLAVLECSRGKSVIEVAASLGVSRQSVYNWAESFWQADDAHTLMDAPRSGRQCQWNEDAQAMLQLLLTEKPEHLGYYATQWTVPLLQEELRHGTGKNYSDHTIRRSLHRLGYVWKRVRRCRLQSCSCPPS